MPKRLRNGGVVQPQPPAPLRNSRQTAATVAVAHGDGDSVAGPVSKRARRSLGIASAEPVPLNPKECVVTTSVAGNYLLLGEDPLDLYIKENLAPPSICTRADDKSYEYNASIYNRYLPSWKFKRDCLHTAEEIMWSQKITSGQVVSKCALNNKPFGESDEKNIAAARAALVKAPGSCNTGASPQVGQAYAIVETGEILEYPYHAAAVIAVDGVHRITLEVFAATTHAIARNTKGTFKMYPVGGDKTFHSYYAGHFTDPVTIVIERGKKHPVPR